ncbi:DNA repair protein RadA [Stenomitos frigidus]|uniref:DNA repair protein RadA n=1 Tax=Stenomitos frigidus ULC18 TaxID=2107698 RepID=A0A2T1DYZ2_9CYAN|nr:DNA repair protein RadA [Stenomitos frigidus]PSB25727.1 DNA repair protein RadA [Stenomitos frigidus ULC18]
MPKLRSHYVCNQCGAESSQYFGKCPACNSWNSLEEQVAPVTNTAARPGAARLGGRSSSTCQTPAQPKAALTLAQISDHPQARLSSGYSELDRVLGGGIVPGSLVLIGGDPGIGKSTLLLQTANRLSQTYRTLYVCAEESAQQVKLRAQRLGVGEERGGEGRGERGEQREQRGQRSRGEELAAVSGQESDAARNSKLKTLPDTRHPIPDTPSSQLYLLPETDLDTILAELESLKPHVAVIDSIQALYFSALSSAPGSVAQVRECTSVLMQMAKRQNITLFIVGHVTKEGAIAGPKVLEHLVDTVLYFEGDRFASHRLLRSVKNRFGATHEIGVFEMVDQGLQEVLNPSELFLGNRDEFSSGSATIVACEGTRPIVVELQALVSPTSYSSPRRSTTGIEYNRLLQILAVLEKRVGIPLSKLDAYVASSGGLSVGEPAADLGVAIAVVASFRDRVVDPRMVLIGEVGLGGQVRPVSQMELRLKEAAKLGFKQAIVPKGQVLPDLGIEVFPVARVVDAIAIALAGKKATNESTDQTDDETD